ncbi:hypothetical protein BpHYR1_010223 [Brachionus plicatilis]|uniref:Uncharacterized protein n=1 Tax=Brachionus plicatilis TaxID=10195 RepID=A0A3M7PE16_BRAPC|nr:hypothetical protein BpHYR1_010223 [Brachionus plicatilis]
MCVVKNNYFENFKELVIVKRRLSTPEITNLFSVQHHKITHFSFLLSFIIENILLMLNWKSEIFNFRNLIKFSVLGRSGGIMLKHGPPLFC